MTDPYSIAFLIMMCIGGAIGALPVVLCVGFQEFVAWNEKRKKGIKK